MTTTTTTTTALASASASVTALQNYTAPEASSVTSLFVDCPSLNTNPIITPRGDKFDIYCGLNIAGGEPDETNPDLTIKDFVGLFAYSFEDCLYACSNANYFAGSASACGSVSWRSNMAGGNASFYANCWLKNGTGQGGADSLSVSAKLMID